jgi:CRP/FNR family transcriptional regulator
MNEHLCACKVPIFSELEYDKLKVVNKLVKKRVYSKDEMIFMEGQPAQNIHIIDSGQVKIFKSSADGGQYIVRLLEDGDFFGELILFKEETLSYSARAITETTVCLINKNDLEVLIRDNPEISNRLLAAMSSRLKKVEDKAHSLALDDSRKRTEKLLADLASENGQEKKEGISIELPLSREGMASIMGMTQETLSRKLSELQKAGKIELIGRRSVLIKDKSLL